MNTALNAESMKHVIITDVSQDVFFVQLVQFAILIVEFVNVQMVLLVIHTKNVVQLLLVVRIQHVLLSMEFQYVFVWKLIKKLHFKLFHQGSPYRSCVSSPECRVHERCINFKCESTQSECSRCGTDAICNRGVCECPNGFIGNPLRECRPECIVDRDCPTDRPACVYDICKNPCDDACGSGADCSLRGLTPVCSCPRDTSGDPLVRCRPFTEEDLCTPNPCGTNAECALGYDKQNRQRPVCNCRTGYNGNPLSRSSRVSFGDSRNFFFEIQICFISGGL